MTRPHAFNTDKPHAGTAAPPPVAWRMRVKAVVQANGAQNSAGGVYECVHWDGTNEGAVRYLVAAAFPFSRRVATPGGVDQVDTELLAIKPYGGTGRTAPDGRQVQLVALAFMPCARAPGQFLFLELADTFGTVCWSPGPRFADAADWLLGAEE